MDVREEKYLALKKVHQDFADIRKEEQCRTCACFYVDMMGVVLEAVKAFRRSENGNELADVEKDFEKWLTEASSLDLHKCMGCRPCLPVPTFNKFSERMDTLNSLEQSELQPVKVSTFSPSEFKDYPWPVQPGDYEVLQAKASVAVVLLGNLGDFHACSSLEGIAIAGSLTTENLGVEHILKNVIANPFIRHMFLFGKDVSGHLPGNALISLVDNGIGNSHKILGATGARAILKNVLTSEVEHFRRQITIHNLMNQNDFTSLKEQVLMLNSSEPVPFKAGLRVDLVGVTEATPASKLRLDPEGYFVVMIRKGRKNPIYVEHYRNDGRITNIVEGQDAATVCSTILRIGLVSQMDHAAYLGRELAKAELSLLTDKVYIQDRAQGDLPCE